ncbi:Ribonuclease ZC3H12A [Channa argus]|uniref:Ribonuclease ZC3H12A n=1 Tax=Channa argus TaxID=215402 RepID=A0A6G1QY39_CHAAH|nr:Ribonuclease ZC3H12A [Channa argus]
MWSAVPALPSLKLTDSAWIFSSLLPAQNSSRPCCEKMYHREMDPSTDPQFLEAQLDFFHKLGYSTAQVQAVQHKFGTNMDTDKLLGELVKVGARREGGQRPVTMMSVLVPKGDLQTSGPTLQLPVAASSTQSREESIEDEDSLKPVVIDGSNVAMSHGNKEVFSCLGIQLAVNFFLDRGHTEVTVFVPSWRKEQPRPDVPITDQHILRDLEKRKILVFTPSRRVAGKRVVCNDDCFIVKLAFESDGIIVSNDMYRDLQAVKPEWKRFIEERLLMYSFVNNKFMPPDDPLGRHGPTLENFLRMFPKTQKKQLCPYGKKCTYGIKCKFHHPERAKQSNRSLADDLRLNNKHPSTAQKQSSPHSSPVPGQSLSEVEDMAKRLTLGHYSSSVKQDHKNEHVVQVKLSQRSSKRVAARKEKASQHPSSDHDSVQHGDSQEQLDSGLGSIDSQPMEAPWSVCEQQYRAAYGSCQLSHSVKQQHCHPRSAPCSCCSHSAPSRGASPALQHNNQLHSIGPGPYHYPSYGKYAGSMHIDFQHSLAHSHPQQSYWSDQFGAHPAARRSLPGESSQWDPPQATQPSPSREEREVVRKKLLAIFSAQLVDMAMDMFPQMMDPQMLVAEILMLQSQNRLLR